jgi:signal transduction histidine kinase
VYARAVAINCEDVSHQIIQPMTIPISHADAVHAESQVIGQQPIAAAAVQAALNTTVRDMLRPAAATMSAMYCAYSIGHYLLLTPAIAQIMVPVALLSALLNGIVWFWLYRRPLAVQYAHLMIGGFAVVVVGNSILHLALTAELRQTTNIALAMIAIASAVLSVRWLIGLYAAVFVGWLITVAQLPPDPEFSHYVVMLAAACLLGALIYVVRARTYRRLHTLHLRDAEQHAALNALLSVLRANEVALTQARDAAQSASKAKSIFVTQMSHELRTPLASIIGYTDLLREHDWFEKDPLAAEDLQRIRAAGWHLLELINGLLDLARAESGRLVIEPQPVDLAELLDDVSQTVKPLIERRSNTLVIDNALPPDLVITDPLRLRQVLLNLLSNASKFTDAGTITLRAVQHDYVVKFGVSDTGIGIPADVQAQLFQDFVQGDHTIQGGYGGTGLGLALSRRICELLEGEITVVSEVGKGSTFTVTLPYRRVSEPVGAEPRWGGKHVNHRGE